MFHVAPKLKLSKIAREYIEINAVIGRTQLQGK